MQTNVIRGMIVTKFGSISKFADALGWAPNRVSRILRKKQSVTNKDIKQMADALEIKEPSDVVTIFL